MSEQHQCTQCGEVTGHDGFYFRDNRARIRQPCKVCISAYGSLRDRTRKRETQRRSYQKTRKEILVRGRTAQLTREFGMTPDEYHLMLAMQEGKCAICRGDETVTDPRYGHIRMLAVDHCHDTNTIRGLLCSRCNLALGMFGENIGNLVAGIHYLKRHQARSQTDQGSWPGAIRISLLPQESPQPQATAGAGPPSS